MARCCRSCYTDRRRKWRDSAYSGHRHVIPHYAPQAKSVIQMNAHRHRPLSEQDRVRNRTKSKVRAQVEHAFLIIKQIFDRAKVRYRRHRRTRTGSRSVAGQYVST